MKTKYIIALAVLLFIVVGKTYSQDECPSFKMGRKKVKLRFVAKMKKKEAIIKFSPTLNFANHVFAREESYTKQNGQITNHSYRDTGNPNTDIYYGFYLPLSYETRIAKKSTLQFNVGYEMLWRPSFPDTLLFDYPTVDMTQYMDPIDTLVDGSSSGFGTGEIRNFDEIQSSNWRAEVHYRYYPFKKAYKGLYLSPGIGVSYGKNKYFDFDTNPNNINYGYTQKNMVFNFCANAGYQFIIKKHFVIDLSGGTVIKQSLNFDKQYDNKEATDDGLKIKYPNSQALHNKYKPAFSFTFGVGYKF